MIIKVSTALCGLLFGVLLGIALFTFAPQSATILSELAFPRKDVIGFLPYWQLSTAKTDYSNYITTLAYFGFALGSDGKILKLATAQEREPGWNAFVSGKATPFLTTAKKEGLMLSLVIFSGNSTTIDTLLQQPTQNAHHLVTDIEPIMQKYGFSDVNMDIEYTATASESARNHFTQFLTTIKKAIPTTQTLTVEVMSTDAVKENLIDIPAIGKIADHVVIMAYDYHSPDSFVTGPVAPLSGALKDSEYDVTTALQQTLTKVPAQKVILGIPVYGYEWESLAPFARSAVIPGSGVIASNHRAEILLTTCATCSAVMDKEAEELHISYFNTDTNTYHQIFIPTENSTKAKLALSQQQHIGGVALWALGYEGKTILAPLSSYK